jgi:hypothetical protein
MQGAALSTHDNAALYAGRPMTASADSSLATTFRLIHVKSGNGASADDPAI